MLSKKIWIPSVLILSLVFGIYKYLNPKENPLAELYTYEEKGKYFFINLYPGDSAGEKNLPYYKGYIFMDGPERQSVYGYLDELKLEVNYQGKTAPLIFSQDFLEVEFQGLTFSLLCKKAPCQESENHIDRYFEQIDKNKGKQTVKKINQLEEALRQFKKDIGRYPTSAEGLEVLVQNSGRLDNWKGPYSRKEDIIDPWKMPLEYSWIDKHKFEISSFGADSEYGTKDDISKVFEESVTFKKEFLAQQTAKPKELKRLLDIIQTEKSNFTFSLPKRSQLMGFLEKSLKNRD